MTELPVSSPYTQHAWYFTGVCYRRHLGDYAKTLEYYQKVVDEWPNYQYAWSAQCLIGECYEKLRDSGVLSESEANPKIEQAYMAVIERYPTCSLAGHACLKLAWPNFQRGRWVEAAMYLELFLQKGPDDPRRSRVLYDLGQAYEKMAEFDAAVQTYRRFIQSANPDDQRIQTVRSKLKKLEGVEK